MSQLAVEAGIYLTCVKFEVINLVGALNLGATLNCSAFAEAHRATCHYDKDSFVGLAWRGRGEANVVEIYSSGRANLPGSTSFRNMVHSTYRMLPELLKFSSSSHLVAKFPKEIQDLHVESDEKEHSQAEERALAWAEQETERVDDAAFGGARVDTGLLDHLSL